jgi:hypothetical protein
MMNKAIQLYKEHNTNLFHSDKFYTKEDIDNTFLQNGTIFNSIEDGISILDGDFNIQNINFTMQTWYSHKKHICGEKCFAVYHDRNSPCAGCPIIRALREGTASRDIIAYRNEEKKVSGWHDLQAFPVMDQGRIVGVVEYVKDITYEVDLYAKISSIEHDMIHIKEQNQLLKQYLQQKESEKEDIRKNISENVKKYIKPVLKQMKDSFSEKPMESGMVSLVESLFENIVKPHWDGATDLNDFTSREIQIMALVKDGRTTKEIAEALCLSAKTVDFHRANIRQKFGLTQGKDNLRAYLLSRPFNFNET